MSSVLGVAAVWELSSNNSRKQEHYLKLCLDCVKTAWNDIHPEFFIQIFEKCCLSKRVTERLCPCDRTLMSCGRKVMKRKLLMMKELELASWPNDVCVCMLANFYCTDTHNIEVWWLCNCPVWSIHTLHDIKTWPVWLCIYSWTMKFVKRVQYICRYTWYIFC